MQFACTMHEQLLNLLLAGAGKTYTMAGNRASYTGRGLIPRCIAALLSRLGSTPGLASWTVSVSYLEIYNESLYDLLNLTAQPHGLSLYEDGRGHVQVGGGCCFGGTKPSTLNPSKLHLSACLFGWLEQQPSTLQIM
jgi:hypothetical protein